MKRVISWGVARPVMAPLHNWKRSARTASRVMTPRLMGSPRSPGWSTANQRESTKILAAGDRFVVAFAHFRRKATDEVEMGAGLEPCALDQWRGRGRGGRDDIGRGAPPPRDRPRLSRQRRAPAPRPSLRRRFHTSTSRILGRTARCAATRKGANAPAPTMSNVSASGRDRSFEPRAESAAVLR